MKSGRTFLFLNLFPEPKMHTQPQSLQKFQDYVSKTKDTDYGLGSVDEDSHYAARLSKTLQSLQNQVKQHEAALEKVCTWQA